VNNLLVIGERPEQAQALAERLGLFGIETIPCARVLNLAVRCLTSNTISVILLDVDALPETAEFFRLLHDLTEVPIVARGATSNPEQLIWYLDNGAADYVGRVTTPPVLAAKLLSLIRAVRPVNPGRGSIRVGALAIDLDSYSVYKSGISVSLTPIEFRLLRALVEKVGKACSHQELLERVWGEDFSDCSHYLRLYVAYLRNKLEDDPRRPKVLITEWGYGYRLAEVAAVHSPVRSRSSLRVAATG